MSVELRPLGVKCNLLCQYCYQNPQRGAGNVPRTYNLEAMKEAVLQEGGPFGLFGGEPLLVPKADLQELFAWGFERFGQTFIQTNGSLIDDDHISMFRRYNVHVGVSMDGPGSLNDIRWAGTLERTRKLTAYTRRAIERLCAESMAPSLIVTLHRKNATGKNLEILIQWLRALTERGVCSIRLHLLEVDDPCIREHYALTDGENIDALLAFAQVARELTGVWFDVFSDMERMLLGQDNGTSCVWNGCDPYTTRAVQGVEGNGQRSNCGRTNKDGVDFVKSAAAGYERYLALYSTPQSVGGCKECRFFLMCKGQCPGTALDSDWRNRTEHCQVWKTLYTWMEAELLARGQAPLSLLKIRQDVEAKFVKA
jgi:uncharacterized protein